MVRLNLREMVNFSSRKEHCPIGIAQSSIQLLFNGGLPNRAFVGPRETRAMKTSVHEPTRIHTISKGRDTSSINR